MSASSSRLEVIDKGASDLEPALPPLPAISAGLGLKNGIENKEHRGRFMANRLGRHPLCLATASNVYVTLECSLEDTLLREELGLARSYCPSRAASHATPR